jgi:hypothetical protein
LWWRHGKIGKKLKIPKFVTVKARKKMPIMSQKIRATRLASTDNFNFGHGEINKEETTVDVVIVTLNGSQLYQVEMGKGIYSPSPLFLDSSS